MTTRTARLDRILIRLGYVDEDQITRALAFQRTHGGRMGMHLVQMGAINESQLAEALAEQFALPWSPVGEEEVALELLPRMPPGSVGEGMMLPLGWDERTRTLALAVGDPADETRLEEVKRAFDARRLKLTMAPENRLRELGRRLSGGSAGAPEYRIALPELFQGRDEGEPGSADAASGALPRLVMVAAGAPRRDFLPPLFRREGWDLTVVDGPEGLREALARGPVARVLVAEELAAEVKEIGRAHV